MNIGFSVSLITYIALGVINPIYSCYVFPYLLAFAIPNVVGFMTLNKHKWVYLLIGVFFVIGLFVFSYLDILFYPSLLVFITLPLIGFNFIHSFIHKFHKVFK